MSLIESQLKMSVQFLQCAGLLAARNLRLAQAVTTGLMSAPIISMRAAQAALRQGEHPVVKALPKPVAVLTRAMPAAVAMPAQVDEVVEPAKPAPAATAPKAARAPRKAATKPAAKTSPKVAAAPRAHRSAKAKTAARRTAPARKPAAPPARD